MWSRKNSYGRKSRTRVQRVVNECTFYCFLRRNQVTLVDRVVVGNYIYYGNNIIILVTFLILRHNKTLGNTHRNAQNWRRKIRVKNKVVSYFAVDFEGRTTEMIARHAFSTYIK